MKIKANKILAVLCVIAMLMTMIVPMTLTATAADTPVATFEFGANGDASHVDGSDANSYEETNNGYTFSFAVASKVYKAARDAKGNSCLKLGTSKLIGSFSFTVPDDVTSVVFHVAKYKTNATKIDINGTSYTLSKSSNDGAYDEITIDTTSQKTITFKTVASTYRCMINTIEFYVAANGGEEIPKCDVCTWGEYNVTTPATCTVDGVKTRTCTVCGEKDTAVIKATGHLYDNGVCKCGDIEEGVEELTIAQAITVGKAKEHNTYTDGEYYVTGKITNVYNTTYGNMYITDGEGNEITVYGLYSGDTRYDAMTTKPVAEDTIKIYGIIGNYNGNAQFKNAQLIEIVSDEPDCEHNYEDAIIEADCTTDGKKVSTCTLCGDEKTEVIPATGHKFVNKECTVCGEKEKAEATITFDNVSKRTEYSTSKQVWTENGITVTNNKANATTNVADYANPARFYKGSELIISGASNITTIIFYCNSATYATDLSSSIEGSTVNGKIVTVTLDGSSKEYQFKFSAKVFLDSISVVYAEEKDPSEELNNVKAEMQLAFKYVEEDDGTFSHSQFVLNVAVDAALAEIDGVDAFGIKVVAGKNEVYYTFDDEKVLSWKNEGGKLSVSIDLGDMLDAEKKFDAAKFATEFTACAFVRIGDEAIDSMFLVIFQILLKGLSWALKLTVVKTILLLKVKQRTL